jgi:acylphosphatase
MARVGRHVIVTGRVQGVWFRAWTQQQAEELGVAGWVRNCRDGSVETELWGDQERVERLIERLREGPPAAQVDDVVITEIEPQPREDFKVNR